MQFVTITILFSLSYTVIKEFSCYKQNNVNQIDWTIITKPFLSVNSQVGYVSAKCRNLISAGRKLINHLSAKYFGI